LQGLRLSIKPRRHEEGTRSTKSFVFNQLTNQPLRIPFPNFQIDTFPNCSSLADFIHTNASLSAAFETVDGSAAEAGVFGGSALHAFAPHAKTGGLHLLAHKFNYS